MAPGSVDSVEIIIFTNPFSVNDLILTAASFLYFKSDQVNPNIIAGSGIEIPAKKQKDLLQ